MIAVGMAVLILGACIPFIAGRFGKILPADPGVILLSLWHKPRFPKPDDVPHARLLHQKWMKLWSFSLFWGIVMLALFGVVRCYVPTSLVPWAMTFLFLVAFCIVVDAQYCLLPDFFTIPLLILGFGMAIFTDALTVKVAFSGAVFGYLLATVSVLIMGLFKQAEFGAGDVKMMTAVGAWLGVFGLNYALLLSFFLFAIQTLSLKRKAGPYGPALGIASILVFLMMYVS